MASQSVLEKKADIRTTFNLPKSVHEKISILSAHFKLSKKDIFGRLLSYMPANFTLPTHSKTLLEKERRVYVVSRYVSDILKRKAAQFGMSRDELVVLLMENFETELKRSLNESIENGKTAIKFTKQMCENWNGVKCCIENFEKDKNFKQVADLIPYIDTINEFMVYLYDYVHNIIGKQEV